MNLSELLSTQIESVVDNFVSGAVGNVITTAVPLVTIALTLSLMLQGLMMMASPSGQPLSELLKRFFGIAMISTFATAGGFYQANLASMIMNLPEEMSSALLAGTGISASNITEMIDDSLAVGMDIIVELSLEGNWRKWAPYMMAALFAVILIVVCGLALAYIIVAKVLLAITVAFGPAFIFLLLFKSTRGLFSKWVGTVINYAVLMVLLAAVLSFLMSFFQTVLTDVRDDVVPYWEGILATGILGTAAVVATLKLPGLASSWGGGIASTLLGFLPVSIAAGLARATTGPAAPAPTSPQPEASPNPGGGQAPQAGNSNSGGQGSAATGGQAGKSQLKYARR